MRYHNITKDDMLNGDGLRVVLWVAGCSHCCKECQNPITWDPDGGLPFDEEAKQEIFRKKKKVIHIVIITVWITFAGFANLLYFYLFRLRFPVRCGQYPPHAEAVLSLLLWKYRLFRLVDVQ